MELIFDLRDFLFLLLRFCRSRLFGGLGSTRLTATEQTEYSQQPCRLAIEYRTQSDHVDDTFPSSSNRQGIEPAEFRVRLASMAAAQQFERGRIVPGKQPSYVLLRERRERFSRIYREFSLAEAGVAENSLCSSRKRVS